MAARRKSSQTLVLDTTESTETSSQQVLADLAPAIMDDEVTAALCPTCGELLAWHEQNCSDTPVLPATPVQTKARVENAEESIVDETMPNLAPAPYAFALGQAVQPEPTAPVQTIVWRGHVKAKHPDLGLVYRLNVYRLNNDYWDCYYESELQAA